MANNYGYGSSGYGSSGYGAADGSGYTSRAGDSYFSYSGTNPLASSSEFGKYSSGGDLGLGSSIYSTQSMLGSAARSIYSQWGGIEGAGDASGIKRSTDALYHQSILGGHNTIGQSEGLFSTNSMFKRPRYETASNLPIYPQRPGEKDCAHYMLTRTCKFGESCKFDHPIWVPEGGIPEWKEVPLAPTGDDSLPERPGEPDCPYFMKTQKCKYGYRCKFNHPKYQVNQVVEFADPTTLPERPSEPICSFYAKTGNCKFGANCKFHHPKGLQIPSSGHGTGSLEQIQSAVQNIAAGYSVPATAFVPPTPALLHNSKGLPIRPGETDCPFYLKTGSCKFGATCRFNHPDRTASLPFGLINPVASLIPGLDPLLAQASFGVNPTVYPQRPGQMECDFYMKTGHCKFGETCKFHHPVDRMAPAASVAKQAEPNVKLTLAGLPRREGTVACPFYMKTGTCKYGVECRFDHPPPGEAIEMATVQGGAATAASGEESDAAEPAKGEQ